MPSVAPPQEEIGQSSIGSPEPMSAQELSEAESRLGAQLEHDAGVVRMGRMIGLQSVRRSLKAEDQQAERDMEAGHKGIWGEGVADKQSGGSEEMDVLAGGNVTINHNYPPVAEKQKPSEPTTAVPPAVLPVVAKGMSTAAKLGAAALIGGPIGIAIASYPFVSNWLKPTPSVVQPTGSLLQDYDLLIGPPKKPETE